MAFLSSSDYQDLVKDSVINQITENTVGFRVQAEARAEAQIRSRLAVRYDVNNIFIQTGNNRNQEIVMIYVDMVLYHLHTRLTPGQVPQIRHDRYQDALDWLDKVASGSYKPALLEIADADGDGVSDGNVIQWGGGTARNPYY